MMSHYAMSSLPTGVIIVICSALVTPNLRVKGSRAAVTKPVSHLCIRRAEPDAIHGCRSEKYQSLIPLELHCHPPNICFMLPWHLIRMSLSTYWLIPISFALV